MMIKISNGAYHQLMWSFHGAMTLFEGKGYCVCATPSNSEGFMEGRLDFLPPRDSMERAFGKEFFHSLQAENKGVGCVDMEYAFRRINEMISSGEIIIE
ncbi:MAG: hypothetical protein IPJ68_05515 [Candidatus Moraniibacteriota bacterium]|nr:MAG: hypothetical protein IPJ68_05515 [Candidatus Moranbacteria bacterium]